MKYFETFAGVGGIGEGLPKNCKCVGLSEFDKYASMVLNYHYPKIKNYGDIKKINWNEVPDFDLLTGGSPCQDFSISGKRRGLAGAKSSLAWEFIRALENKKPKYFIWENVKGVMSSRRGWDLANLITAFSETGYSLWWQILNAKDFGVPQNRERIFIFGTREKSFPEIFFKPENLRWDDEATEGKEKISKSLTTRSERYDPTAQTYIANTITTKQNAPSRTQRREKENYIATALKTPSGGGILKTPTSQYKIRRFTPLESERIMSWPDNWTKLGKDEEGNILEISDNQRYKMCGNGVATKVVRIISRELLK